MKLNLKHSEQNLINDEIIGSFILIGTALLALLIKNSFLAEYYSSFLNIKLSVKINEVGLNKPLLLWINDGLMAIFFLLVGLELKREVCAGELKEFKKIILPVAGATGGVLAPICIFYLFNNSYEHNMAGWAIPMATDIAFALGILSLFGKRVPVELTIFLLTLAIIDDLAAILVIGIYHTTSISFEALMGSGFCIVVLFLFNLMGIKKLALFLMTGFLLWLATLQSGFHATIAGVILGLFIPYKTKSGDTLLHDLEEGIKPLVTFFVLPVFAFANSGIPLDNISLSDVSNPIVLGIAFGLLFGNLIGVTALTTIVGKLLKIDVSYSFLNLVGVSLICGIGFTMSLFISGLSFSDNFELLNLSRLAIILGSSLSMGLGCLVLNYSLPQASSHSRNKIN